MSNLIDVMKREQSSHSKHGSNHTFNNILECVGNTPLVKLNKIPKIHKVECEIYVKCEFMNPAGSIKDRIGTAMIKDATDAGAVKENTKLIEATSGNTGIAIAFNSAILGKKCTIVMDEKNSAEKVDTMHLMGAEILKIKGHTMDMVRQLKEKDPDNVVLLNQYANHINPKVHYDTTGAEIVSAMDRVDMAVMGAGTGGTVSGVGLKLKETYSNCIVVVGEPEGGAMFNKYGKHHPYLVEGIGYGPDTMMTLDKSVVDQFEIVTDQESFLMARELAKKEGILCGGSAGLAVAAAIKAAKRLNIGEGKKVVVILADGIRNYMTKFVSDQWMEARLFMDPPQRTMRWWKDPITQLVLSHKYPKLMANATCEEALGAMTDGEVAVVVDERGRFLGAISKDSLRNFATNPLKLPSSTTEEFNFEDRVSKHLAKDCYTLAKNGKNGMPTIGLLSRILDITPFVVIGEEAHDNDKDSDYFIPKGVVTGADVLDYIYARR